ncbi:MAG: hypothetical protein ACOC4J_04955 [Bacteroidota bacterium]
MVDWILTVLFWGCSFPEHPLIPIEKAQYYQTVMEKVGSRCDLKLYEGQKQGFFNYGNFEFYQKTIKSADLFFLQSLGYMQKTPEAKIE